MTIRRWTAVGVAVGAMSLSSGPARAQDRAAQPAEPQQPPIQARPGTPDNAPRSKYDNPVAKGTRLIVSNNAGEVVIRGWDRDQLLVEASHSSREKLDVSQANETTVRVRTRSERGPAGLVDYRISVPRWMAVNLTGTYLEADIEGTAAEVTVETVGGNVRVSGGSGAVSLRSVEGTITVEKTTGKVQASAVNEGIRLSNTQGEVVADSINGDVVIINAQTSSLEVSTVNGDVTFNGTVRDNGVYRLTTHGGDVRVGLGGAANATVFVRTFQGDFEADFPIELPEGQTGRSGSKRFNFTLGTGSARIEVQSFNGDITLARKSVMTEEEERRNRRTPRTQPPKGDLAGLAWSDHAEHEVRRALQEAAKAWKDEKVWKETFKTWGDLERMSRDAEKAFKDAEQSLETLEEPSPTPAPTPLPTPAPRRPPR